MSLNEKELNLLESLYFVTPVYYMSKENNMTILYQLGHGKYTEKYIVKRPATSNNNNITTLNQSGHCKYRNII